MNTGKIKLSHFSVKEYLLSTHVEEYFSINEKSSHSKIVELSVAYLLQFDDSSPLTTTMLDSMPLARYAARHWIGHAKSGGVDSTALQLILRLFISESAPHINWIEMRLIKEYDNLIDASEEYDDLIDEEYDELPFDRSEVCCALYYSSLAGIQEVSACLLRMGENVNAEGGWYGNALQAASYEGSNEAIVKLLLENGAEVNAEGGYFGNSLQAAAASYGGNESIVKLLLENGAEVNKEGGFYGNALQAASYQGNEAIVKLLLENGAEVNAEGGYYGNALLAAAASYPPSNEVVVKLLLDNGAEVNAVEGGKYGNALHAASSCGRSEGNEAIVKLLLENGHQENSKMLSHAYLYLFALVLKIRSFFSYLGLKFIR